MFLIKYQEEFYGYFTNSRSIKCNFILSQAHILKVHNIFVLNIQLDKGEEINCMNSQEWALLFLIIHRNFKNNKQTEIQPMLAFVKHYIFLVNRLEITLLKSSWIPESCVWNTSQLIFWEYA